VAIAIDEVKYKKGHKYLTVVCDHLTGTVVWAATGRSKDTVGKFFDALGDRADQLVFVTADGATWITDVVAERAPHAIVCLDTFHVIGWATGALDEVRRNEWNKLRHAGRAGAAKEFKGLRFLLRRNWENLTTGQRATIRSLESANRRTFRRNRCGFDRRIAGAWMLRYSRALPSLSYRFRWVMVPAALALCAAGVVALTGLPGVLAPMHLETDALEYIAP